MLGQPGEESPTVRSLPSICSGVSTFYGVATLLRHRQDQSSLFFVCLPIETQVAPKLLTPHPKGNGHCQSFPEQHRVHHGDKMLKEMFPVGIVRAKQKLNTEQRLWDISGSDYRTRCTVHCKLNTAQLLLHTEHSTLNTTIFKLQTANC